MPPKNTNVDLKLKYQRVFEVGLIVSISLLIVAFRYLPNLGSFKSHIIETQPLIEIIDIPSTGAPEIPTPPKPPIPVEAPTDDNLEDILIDDTEIDLNEHVNQPPQPIEEVDNDLMTIFRVVEHMPEIIGGIGKIQSQVVYPEIAVRAGVQGKVFVQAIIGKDGIVESAVIKKGIGAGCDEAAINAVMKTKFKPGMQRGKPVRVQVSIPISFKLN